MNEHLRPSYEEPLRYRYFKGGNGKRYVWTTEADYDCRGCDGGGCADCDGNGRDEKGWYWSFMYVPYGKGARSGKARSWRLDEKTKRRHRKRKDAKARALKLYRKDQG